jgi:hypothetical protein
MRSIRKFLIVGAYNFENGEIFFHFPQSEKQILIILPHNRHLINTTTASIITQLLAKRATIATSQEAKRTICKFLTVDVYNFENRANFSTFHNQKYNFNNLAT